MQADIDEMIHQATDNETVCDGCVFAYVKGFLYRTRGRSFGISR